MEIEKVVHLEINVIGLTELAEILIDNKALEKSQTGELAEKVSSMSNVSLIATKFSNGEYLLQKSWRGTKKIYETENYYDCSGQSSKIKSYFEPIDLTYSWKNLKAIKEKKDKKDKFIIESSIQNKLIIKAGIDGVACELSLYGEKNTKQLFFIDLKDKKTSTKYLNNDDYHSNGLWGDDSNFGDVEDENDEIAEKYGIYWAVKTIK